jgi:hypothetical protein
MIEAPKVKTIEQYQQALDDILIKEKSGQELNEVELFLLLHKNICGIKSRIEQDYS